ncbi:aspartate aminotransferase family protein [Allostella sp. ATCC 35155]|nr:aspartate aminotransferase family protein [Stella sp. ATCC 35155]
MTHFAANSPHARDIATLVHPGTNLRKHIEVGPTIVSRGEGIFVSDDSGRTFLDGGAGLWCASLGFGNERLARVAYEAIRNLGYYHLYRHASNEASIDLAEKLLSIAPVPMSKVLLQSSGSEANDTAAKLVWYYWNAVGKPEKRKLIARRQAYHGSGIASVSLTGKPEFHAAFGLPLPGFLHTEFPHHYREGLPGESEEAFSTRMADALDRLIEAEGPETVGGFWAEPVMGAGGAVLPPKGYFEKIQAVLKKHDVLFVADEVICGFGRTGNWWGSQTFGLQPDLISCAKALSAAMQPISAVLISERIYQAMLTQSDRLGAFVHGYTYAGHPVAAAVALETLKIYEEMGIVDHVRALEPVFLKELSDLPRHPLVGDARGCGLIGGIEIVADKETRAIHDKALDVPGRIDRHARDQGLILRFVGNRIAFSPPLVITAEQIGDMMARLRRALDATADELARG